MMRVTVNDWENLARGRITILRWPLDHPSLRFIAYVLVYSSVGLGAITWFSIYNLEFHY